MQRDAGLLIREPVAEKFPIWGASPRCPYQVMLSLDAAAAFLMWLIVSKLININLNQRCMKIKKLNICKFKLSLLIMYIMM